MIGSLEEVEVGRDFPLFNFATHTRSGAGVWPADLGEGESTTTSPGGSDTVDNGVIANIDQEVNPQIQRRVIPMLHAGWAVYRISPFRKLNDPPKMSVYVGEQGRGVVVPIGRKSFRCPGI